MTLDPHIDFATADAAGAFTMNDPTARRHPRPLVLAVRRRGRRRVSDGRFADDFTHTPTCIYAYQPLASKKVLSGTQMADDVDELGATNSDWPGRSSITKIEVSFRAIGSTQPWGARFHVDQVGWL